MGANSHIALRARDGSPGTVPTTEPGPLGIPRAASPIETSLFFFIPFLGQTPIRPGIQRPQVQGKRAGVQVSEPGTPVLPQKMEGKQSARTRGRSGAGHHDERSLFMGGR